MTDDVEFIDTTMRDGQQSLWGMRMQGRHMLAMADDIDRVGYRIVDLVVSNVFEAQVRFGHEDPWDVLDHVRAAMPNSKLRAGMRSFAIVGFSRNPDSLMELWVRTLAKHGVSSFWLVDCLFDLEKMKWISEIVHDTGSEIVPCIMYGNSPVHTDEYFANIAKQMAAFPNVGSIMLADEAGVLRPDGARTLIPALLDAAGKVPLELHFHSTTGMAPLNYMIGVESGARILHTASRPLATGPSLPSVEGMLDNLKHTGHTHKLRPGPLPRIAKTLNYIAELEDRPLGVPNEYREFNYKHQLPGGMTGTLLAQLATYNMTDRLEEVLEEAAVVRTEVGYPPSATPFSQLIGIQAVLNIVTGERYKIVPDEMILYALGHLGTPAAEFDANALDAILSSPRGKEFVSWEQPQPSLKELRHEYGESLSDEELLLRVVMPKEDVDAAIGNGPIRTELPPPPGTRAAAIARDIIENATSNFVHVEQQGLNMTLKRGCI
jgi:oxaloacetate decarboxylase (Na+ extruding) subunit alpha